MDCLTQGPPQAFGEVCDDDGGAAIHTVGANDEHLSLIPPPPPMGELVPGVLPNVPDDVVLAGLVVFGFQGFELDMISVEPVVEAVPVGFAFAVEAQDGTNA